MNKNNKPNFALVIIIKNKKYYKIKTLIVLLIYLPIIFLSSLDNDGNSDFRIELSLEKKLKDYLIKNFSIIRRIECPTCGFFSHYIVYTGCIYKFLSEGYIPIVDLQSFKNIYNYGNRTIKNPCELSFCQPFNYTLEEVKLYAKNVKYLNCTSIFYRPNELDIYYNNKINTFWHNFALKYIHIKTVCSDKNPAPEEDCRGCPAAARSTCWDPATPRGSCPCSCRRKSPYARGPWGF